MQANGRINILSYNPNDRFILHDKIPTGQSTSYRDALNGNWESSSLSNSFFSASNIRTIQNKLKEGVLKISNGSFVIGDQDEDTLKIIMRSIFLQHSTNQRNNIEGQINALNTLVLNYAIPQVYGEAQGYIQYRKDVSTLAVPITRPTSTYENNTLELKKWF
jgi:hypothetical protein|tara:strand:+ start:682 stop:1167 length:486 start_codon:yes stop_codon:yes gene_type:complete